MPVGDDPEMLIDVWDSSPLTLGTRLFHIAVVVDLALHFQRTLTLCRKKGLATLAPNDDIDGGSDLLMISVPINQLIRYVSKRASKQASKEKLQNASD